jgi:hypothetical protein
MIRRGVGVALLLVSASIGLSGPGCLKEPAVDVSPHERKFKPRQYDDILKRWTRHRRIIKNFDTVVNTHITYLSAEYVSAHAVLYAKHYRLTEAEKRRYLVKRLAEVRGHHEFFMAATTADPRWNDFDRKESIWRITLNDDKGTRVKPLIVKRIKPTEVHRTYFPYVTVFHRTYHVIFPKTVGGKPFITPKSKWFKLVLACPLGSTELAWFIKSRS